MIVAEIDMPDLTRQLNAVGTSIEHVNMNKILKACGVLIVNDLKQNIRKGVSPDGTPFKPLRFPRPNGKSAPLWDTGALVRSIGVMSQSNDGLTIGTNLEYAALQQYGGTVTPKNVQWLTILITTKAKAAGGARNFPGKLNFVPFGRGKAALRETRQARGKSKPITHYLLVKSVKIPPRPFVGFSEAALKGIDDIYAKMTAG